jgi:riboflavin kinase/FMN adenylyltransferase
MTAPVQRLPTTLSGHVVQGDQRGRQLGFRTANIPTGDTEDVPPDGVYAGWLRRLDGREPYEAMPAAISVGTNPTFTGERRRRVESHVLDRDDLDLYGVRVEVTFTHHLRGTVKFASVDELVQNLRRDVERAAAILGVGGRGPSVD